MEAAQNDTAKSINGQESSGRVSAVVLGIVLFMLTLILGVVGVRSVSSVQHAILQAAVKAPESPHLDHLITSWPNLVMPIVFCVAVPTGLFLIASIMAFRGDLAITYRKKGA